MRCPQHLPRQRLPQLLHPQRRCQSHGIERTSCTWYAPHMFLAILAELLGAFERLDATCSVSFSWLHQIINIGPTSSAQRSLSFNVETLLLVQVEHHAVTIVVGETGSGKTTKIPQYLHAAGWCADGYQVCHIHRVPLTQPCPSFSVPPSWGGRRSSIFRSASHWSHSVVLRSCLGTTERHSISAAARIHLSYAAAIHSGSLQPTEFYCLPAVRGLQPHAACSTRGSRCRWHALSPVAQLQQ